MTPIYSYYFGLILAGICGLFGGWCAAVVHKWSQSRFLVELEYRLDDVEGRVNREVKIRAGAKGVDARNKSDDLVAWAKDHATQGNLAPQNFKDWRLSKMVGPPGG